jgi:membrane protein YqaA with SNARE-associated domain
LAIPLVAASRLGGEPRFTARRLVRPVAVLLAVQAAASLAAGLLGYALGRSGGLIELPRPLIARLSPASVVPFQADAFAHGMAYAVGFFGGLTIVGWVLVRRRAEARAATAMGNEMAP